MISDVLFFGLKEKEKVFCYGSITAPAGLFVSLILRAPPTLCNTMLDVSVEFKTDRDPVWPYDLSHDLCSDDMLSSHAYKVTALSDSTLKFKLKVEGTDAPMVNAEKKENLFGNEFTSIEILYTVTETRIDALPIKMLTSTSGTVTSPGYELFELHLGIDCTVLLPTSAGKMVMLSMHHLYFYSSDPVELSSFVKDDQKHTGEKTLWTSFTPLGLHSYLNLGHMLFTLSFLSRVFNKLM